MVAKCFLVAILSTLFVLSTFARDPIDLTDDSLSSLTSSGVPVFAALTMSWCGHCKALKPVWESLAKTALSKSGSVAIGRADCGEQSALCDSLGAHGYPTLVFVDSKGRKNKYEGPRKVLQLEAYVKRMVGPDVHKVESERDVKRLAFENTATYVLVTKPSQVDDDDGDERGRDVDGHARNAFEDACSTAKAKVVCAMGSSESLSKLAADAISKEKKRIGVKNAELVSDGSEPTLLVFKDGDVRPVSRIAKDILSQEDPVEAMRDVVLANRFPLLTEIKPETYAELVNAGRKVVVAAFDPYWKGKRKWVTMLKALAGSPKFAPHYYFATLDGIQWHEFTKQFGITVDDLPRVVVQDAPEQLHWYNTTIDVLERKELKKWLGDVLDGTEKAKGGGILGKMWSLIDHIAPGLSENPSIIFVILSGPVLVLWLLFKGTDGDDEAINHMSDENNNSNSSGNNRGEREEADNERDNNNDDDE